MKSRPTAKNLDFCFDIIHQTGCALDLKAEWSTLHGVASFPFDGCLMPHHTTRCSLTFNNTRWVIQYMIS